MFPLDKEQVLSRLARLQEELKNYTGPENEGPPQLISIAPDDYRAECIGLTDSGLQFFATPLFIPESDQTPGNEFNAIFLFNDDGELVDSKVDELGPRATMDRERAQTLFEQRMKELGDVEYTDILVKPFAVEHFGVMMGLIPDKYEDEDVWSVTLQPGSTMFFSEPWDSGDYDT